MGTSPSIRDLRALSDEELISRHDAEAKQTVVGTQYYLDELHRRQQEWHTAVMVKYTKYILWLTIIVGFLTAVNVWLVACSGP